jgi:hypothetical protein
VATRKNPTASTKKTMMMSDLVFTELLFPFWCLDAKGEEKYLVLMSFIVLF